MRQTITTYRRIRTTIDKGYPDHAIREIDSMLANGELDGDDRETIAILLGVAKGKQARMSEAGDTVDVDYATWIREMGFVNEAKAY